MLIDSPEALTVIALTLSILIYGEYVKDKVVKFFPWADKGNYGGEKFLFFRHGKGKLQKSDGLYEGDFKYGLRTGKGVFTWTSGRKYEGNYIYGKRTGKGIFLWANGDKYEGDWVNNARTGKGIFLWANGDKYEGDWVNDTRTGKGESTWINGDRYIGDFIDGKRSGNGDFTWANGDRFVGWFRDNIRSKAGWFTRANGDRYVYKIKNGKRSNTGFYSYANGDRYEGEIINDKVTGKGIKTWVNGDRYEGDFLDGKRNGKGVLIWANGDRYEGDFVDDKVTGKGIKTWVNGDRYEGEFLFYSMDGNGVFTWANDNRFEGNFQRDYPRGEGVIIWPDGCKLRGEFATFEEVYGRFSTPSNHSITGIFVCNEYYDGITEEEFENSNSIDIKRIANKHWKNFRNSNANVFEDFFERIEYSRTGYLWYGAKRYYPKNKFLPDQISEEDNSTRYDLYDFKDTGNTEVVGNVISNCLLSAFSKKELSQKILVIIPASTQEKTQIRFKEFCKYVSQQTGIRNGYYTISNNLSKREPKHISGKKSIDLSLFVEVFDRLEDRDFIVFDDVRTTGNSSDQIFKMLKSKGARSVEFVYFGVTVSSYIPRGRFRHY